MTMKRIGRWTLLTSTLALPLLFNNCAKDETASYDWNFWNNMPFQVQDSIPAYLAVNVPKETNKIQVIFTEPANVSSIVAGTYNLKQTENNSTTDITSRIVGVSSPDGGRTVIFAISGDNNGTPNDPSDDKYLKYGAGYELTLYPSIRSAGSGLAMAYVTTVAFTTGPTDNFGFGEIIKEGPPKIQGEIRRDIYCGCAIIYAYFTESLPQAPIFYVENRNAWGLFNAGSQQVPTYQVLTNRTDVWGISLGCMATNQAWDRKVKVTVLSSTVYDLEGEQMGADVSKTFNNGPIYSCP